MTTLDYQNNNMVLKSEYKHVEVCRTLPTRQWDRNNKVWIVPITDHALIIEKFRKQNVDVDTTPRLQYAINTQKELSKMSSQEHTDEVIQFGEDLKLMPFQAVGVQFLEKANGVAMIADLMGLGKSVQTLAYLRRHPEQRPAIIVAPATVKINWGREAEKWLEKTERINVVDSVKYKHTEADVYIINYDILKKHAELLESINAKVIVFDEVQNLKNHKTIRSVVANKLSRNIPYRILLTGTPLMNRPNELWHLLNILSPNTWNSYYRFTERYCNPYKKVIYLKGRRKEVRDISGASNLQELNQRLSTIMIRRLKENVLKELPEKRTSILPVTITNRGEYEQAKKDLFKYLEQTKGTDVAERSLYAEALVKIEVLKQITIRGKMNSILLWLNDFIETEEKLIIFATHRDVINELYQAYEKISVKLTGDSSIRDRQNAIDLFQTNPKIKFFFGNIKASGVGITLTSSSQVIFLESAWTPAEMEQAESRAIRHGQKNAVNVYHMIGVDTIDTKIHELLANKSKIIKQILESKTNKSIETESIQNELVNSLRQEVKEAG